MTEQKKRENKNPEDKLDFKRIFPIFIIVLVDLLGLTIIIPLLPIYAATFGANALVIGVIVAMYPIMQAIGSPVLGGLSDRFGRKPVLVVSQFGTLAGFIMLAFANSIPLLLLSRAIDGISGANIVAARAAITDVTNDRTRAQGLGLIGAAFGLGFTIGPAIAGIALTLTNNDYRVPALIAAFFSLLSIMLTTFWFHETLKPEDREANNNLAKSGQAGFFKRVHLAILTPFVGVLLIIMFVQRIAFDIVEQLLSLFSLGKLGLSGSSIAMLFVFVGIILVAVQGYFIGPWSRRFGERKLIFAGLGLLALGALLVGLVPEQPVVWYSQTEMVASLQESASLGETSIAQTIEVPLPSDENTGWVGLIWMFVALVPLSIGGGLLSPSINSLITKRVASKDVGNVLGVSSALVSMANALAPLIGFAIFQYLGVSAPFFFSSIVIFVLVIVAMQKIPESVDKKPITLKQDTSVSAIQSSGAD